MVTAHPDDVDFGAAGSVASWVADGHDVAYCICTSGDAGAGPAHMPRSEVGALREAEQNAAAAAVGVTDVTYLRYPDGALVAGIALRKDISRAIRRFRPDRVVCQSAERNLDRIIGSHPDHLAAGEATIAAVYPDARNEWAHPDLAEVEGLEPWSCNEVYVMLQQGPTEAMVYVDITDSFDKKVAALTSHVSQVGGNPNIAEFIRGWAAGNAVAGGLEDGRLAEVFRKVTI